LPDTVSQIFIVLSSDALITRVPSHENADDPTCLE
jgi:hypothetical protein